VSERVRGAQRRAPGSAPRSRRGKRLLPATKISLRSFGHGFLPPCKISSRYADLYIARPQTHLRLFRIRRSSTCVLALGRSGPDFPASCIVGRLVADRLLHVWWAFFYLLHSLLSYGEAGHFVRHMISSIRLCVCSSFSLLRPAEKAMTAVVILKLVHGGCK